MSCSAWSKWIEISKKESTLTKNLCLGPHGASGLKFVTDDLVKDAEVASCSAWSKWIEIDILPRATRKLKCLAPHGASGLKFTLKTIISHD